MDVRRIAAEATRDLRHRVLRPDQRREHLVRAGDEDARTAHFGAFDGDRLLAIATVMQERERDPEGPGDWRIRGVATEPDARGRGFGRAVVDACLAHARGSGGRMAWLNGRVSSLPFYARLGFEVVGPPFDTPPTGPHHRFRRVLAADADESWLAQEDALRPRVRLVDDLALPPRTLGGFDVAYSNVETTRPGGRVGIDVAYAGDQAFGALVLLDPATLQVLDTVTCAQPAGPAYAPGFLARREFPVLRTLWGLARSKPDVLFVDGAGVMHPRRMGSATYAGVALDVPTIGITKSPYIGATGARASARAEVREGDELLGHALWPARDAGGAGGKPVFVSAGHRVSQATALSLAFHARRAGERLPEPIRAADAAANAARGAAAR